MLEEAQYKYALAESKRDNLQVGDLEDKVSFDSPALYLHVLPFYN